MRSLGLNSLGSFFWRWLGLQSGFSQWELPKPRCRWCQNASPS